MLTDKLFSIFMPGKGLGRLVEHFPFLRLARRSDLVDSPVQVLIRLLVAHSVRCRSD